MKVIICGGRDFRNYAFMSLKLDSLFANNTPKEIVSGKQKTRDPETGEFYGADWLGEVYAMNNGIAVKPFPADWNKLGKKAGPTRNQQMADYATHCVAFWDGKSKGTMDMITRAKDKGLIVRIVKY